MVLKLLEEDRKLDGVNRVVLGREPYIPSKSAETRLLYKLIEEIAPTEIPVLVVGESGTGKEVVALQIHKLSSHKEMPFVKVRCTALAQGIFQDQLARLGNQSPELIANPAGSLFFDEISELDADCQRSFLHCFPEDSSGNGSLTARILSCTSQNLELQTQCGQFRLDLFYRLNGVCLRLPPLRHRKEDIPYLVEFFLRRYAGFFKRPQMTLANSTLRTLTDYSWPGNIRELENVIKKIVALGDEELGIFDFTTRPAQNQAPKSNSGHCSLKAASRAASLQTERELILETLARTHWNRRRAAEALQISYKSFLSKLKQIQVPGSDQV